MSIKELGELENVIGTLEVYIGTGMPLTSVTAIRVRVRVRVRVERDRGNGSERIDGLNEW